MGLGPVPFYNLPGSIAEIPAALGLSAAEARRSSVEGITGKARRRRRRSGGYDLPGIMGDKSGGGLPRHLWMVIQRFNRNMRKPREAPFTVVTP